MGFKAHLKTKAYSTLAGLAAARGHTERTIEGSYEGVFICTAEDMLQTRKDHSVVKDMHGSTMRAIIRMRLKVEHI